jgi:hypothetical protein
MTLKKRQWGRSPFIIKSSWRNDLKPGFISAPGSIHPLHHSTFIIHHFFQMLNSLKPPLTLHPVYLQAGMAAFIYFGL